MIKAQITIVSDRISPDTKLRANKLSKVAKDAHKKWVEVTPKRTGNARNKTKFQGGDTINADYRYAKQLDRGRSKQAPDGMLKPTVKYLKSELDKIFRKI